MGERYDSPNQEVVRAAPPEPAREPDPPAPSSEPEPEPAVE